MSRAEGETYTVQLFTQYTYLLNLFFLNILFLLSYKWILLNKLEGVAVSVRDHWWTQFRRFNSIHLELDVQK